jgi:preprotein translocase subunit SecG
MFLFLTVLQALVAAALVGVILMQRSEGGGLGIGGGGSPGGMMSARGAADFLTRATRWLAFAFVVLSIALASMAVEMSGADAVESTLDRTVAPAAPSPDPLASDAAPAQGAAGADAPADTGSAGGDDPLGSATR